MHPDLCNRVDVDSDFGTVLNRFCSQVACGYPMSLYGTGEQTRAFININDSVKCLTLALEFGKNNDFSKVNILNQMTACHKLNDLKDLLISLYPDATFEYIDNPRTEKAGNSLKVVNKNFEDLGHKGIDINIEDIKKLVEVCKQNQDRFDKIKDFVKPVSFWKRS